LNTHYPEHALQYANKALLMLPDKASIFGNTKTVITEENLKKAFGISVFIGTEQIANDNYRYIIPLYKQHE
ncbi:MAG: ABC transporter ATP-binding protein, partial [Vescimonas sp.]